jgi:uncharacterized protein YqeY
MGVLGNRLADDLKDAMRVGDTLRRDEIRGLLAALTAERQSRLAAEVDKQGLLIRDPSVVLTPEQTARIEAIRSSYQLSDDEEQSVLLQRVKQHQQSIDGFTRGSRPDLVATEEAQLAVLQQYLPSQATVEDVENAVRAAIAESGAQGPRDTGKVMGLLTQRLRGRADMKQVSTRVQALLAGSS